MILHAGRLELVLDGSDLRYLAHEGQEIVRRIYMAVRDPDWNTVPAVERSRDVEIREDSFAVRMSLSNRQGAVDLDWDLEIDGHVDGRIEYVMRATARAEFSFAKIGLCVHHPIAGVAGRPWAGAAHGSLAEGVMPDLIYPQVPVRDAAVDMPMLPPMTELTIDQAAGFVHFDFGGDLYETEDQRNWSDASYKTYSMPGFTGYHHTVREGERLTQRVKLSFEPRRGEEATRARRPRRYLGPHAEGPVRFELGSPLGRQAPDIGVDLGDRPEAGSDARARLLGPAHLRFDLDLAADGWEGTLTTVLESCAKADAALELALFPAGDPRFSPGKVTRPLERIAGAVAEAGARVARVLVFPAGEEATPAAWIPLLREGLPGDIPVGGGTNLFFNELHRSLPDLRPFPLIAWSVNPQVHAFADADLAENLDGQAEQVRAARNFAGERLLCVSPITLRPRFNPNAREDAPEAEGDNVDGRQRHLFTAAWTIGSYKQVAEAGADSVTYFALAGPCGVFDGGDTFPAFHALADLAALRGAPILRLRSGEEPWVSGLAARQEGSTVALVANLGQHPRTVEIEAAGAVGGQLRILEGRSESLAREDPAAFRDHGEIVHPAGGAFAFELEAHGSARLQMELSHR
ncbi:MAG: hypothetical protein JSS97_07920 [Actinobacteria bacterium]|nr:hypothetical protein [Actinomycetota bacterium]